MNNYNEIFIYRLIGTNKETLGKLSFFNGLRSYIYDSLELPWKGNKNNISCIPTGTYHWHKYLSPDHGYEVVLLENVPGREGIEIHVANYVQELLGCIAIGIGMADINHNGLIDVTKSKRAFDELMSVLPGKGVIHILNSKNIKTKI